MPDPQPGTIEAWPFQQFEKEPPNFYHIIHRDEIWWPSGTNVVTNGGLKRLLASSGRWHARNTLSGFVSADIDALLHAAISCGTAVELVGKSLLASVSHGLLAAERAPHQTRLALAGSRQFASGEITNLRSITAADTVKLVRHMHPSCPIDSPDSVAFEVRNAAAHMALVDSQRLRQGAIVMVKFIQFALPQLGLDEVAFWGQHAHAVAVALLDEAKTETWRTVQAKLAAAQIRVGNLLRTVPEQQHASFLAVLSANRVPTFTSEHREPFQCPACDQDGWIHCWIEREVIEEFDDEDGLAGVVSRTAWPLRFECPVCQLDLREAELAGLDLPDRFELDEDHATLEELGIEPDEDIDRDR